MDIQARARPGVRQRACRRLAGVRWFTPFVEFRTTTPTVAEDHRTQVTLVPGLNVKPFPRSTLAVGVQLPVTSAREFHYQVRALFIKEF
jgi:hypothetical protein